MMKLTCSSHKDMERCNEWALEQAMKGKPGGHKFLTVGSLAYFDAITGPVKVKITEIDGQSVAFRVTANSGPYKKGMLEESSVGWVLPRTSLNVRRQTWDGVPVWFMEPEEKS